MSSPSAHPAHWRAAIRPLLALLLVLGACQPGEWPSTGAGVMAVSELTLDEERYVLHQGASVRARATVRGVGGAVLEGRMVHWESSHPDIFRVDTGGALLGLKGGLATLTVRCEGVTASRQVEVRPSFAQILGVPRHIFIAPGRTLQLQARVVDGSDRLLNVPLVWESRDPHLARVSPEGLLTAVSEGRAVLKVKTQSDAPTYYDFTVEVTSEATVELHLVPTATVPEGGSATLHLQALNGRGEPPALEPVEWEVSDPARVSVRDGVVTGLAPGTVTVTARTSSASATAEVAVLAVPQADVVSLTPPGMVLMVGDTRWMRAQARDAAGVPLFTPQVQWSSSDTTVLGVSPEGQVMALRPGVVTVTAQAGGRSGTAHVEVRAKTPLFPRRLLVFSGDGRTSLPGSRVGQGPPTVRLLEADGTPVAMAPLVMEVLEGGGTFDAHASPEGGYRTYSDAEGFSRAGWRLGTQPGRNLLRVSAPQALPVTLTAYAGAPRSDLAFDFRYGRTLSQGAQAVFRQAAARFQELLPQALPPQAIQLPADACYAGSPAVDLQETRGVVVLVAFDYPDAGLELVSAGVCATRAGGTLPAVGILRLSWRFGLHASPEDFREAITHGLGHVLGLGTLWDRDGLVQQTDTNDPIFVGEAAVAAFRMMGGHLYPGAAVPLDPLSSGEGGTTHWRSAVLQDELMSGSVSSLRDGPLTRITAGALQDLGYAVDLQAGDAWRNMLGDGGTHAEALEAPSLLAAPAPEEVLRPRLTLRPDGTPVALEPWAEHGATSHWRAPPPLVRAPGWWRWRGGESWWTTSSCPRRMTCGE